MVLPQTPLYHSYLKLLADNNIPLVCVFELTYKCNLKCVHCYVSRKRRKELDKSEAISIIKQLKKIGCLYITFTGGEIFVRRDFFEIAEYAKKLNFALRLFTNGTLIDSSIIDKICDLKPILVELSLYGFRNTHDKITQVTGSFDKTIQAIELLREKKINVLVKAVLLNKNVNEIWKLKDFVEKTLKVSWRALGDKFIISPCDDKKIKPLYYRVSNKQYRKYIKESIGRSKSLEEYKPMAVGNNDRICGTGSLTCNITPYGELNPCIQIRLKNNNLKNKSFVKIWKGHRDIEKLRNLHMFDRKDCLGCEYNLYCFVCPGVAFLEKGSFTAKLPYVCGLARIRKEIYEKFSPIIKR